MHNQTAFNRIAKASALTLKLLKKSLKTFLKELNRPRYIDITFRYLEDEEIENERLLNDFNRRIEKIKNLNKKHLIERLSAFYKDHELSTTGLLLTKKELDEKARKTIEIGLKNGNLDEFYNVIHT